MRDAAPASGLTRARKNPARRRLALAAGAMALLLLAAACASPPGPRGWAGARPVTVDAEDIVLVAHKKKLFALPQSSSDPGWQFPPREQDLYGVSERSRDALKDQIDRLGIDADAAAALKDRVDDLNVTGPTGDSLKDAIAATSADENARDDVNQNIDDITQREEKALDDVTAFYGEIGISPDGATTYIGGFGGWVYALQTASGRLLWTTELNAGVVGGVALAEDGDTLYVGTKDDRLYALDAATGDQRWTFDTQGEVWAAPTIDEDGAIYATSLDGTVYKLTPDGDETWSFVAGGGIGSRAVVEGDTVYVGAFNNELYAIDAANGDQRWSFGEAGNWFWATPLVREGIVYAPSLDGKVYGVDAESGESAWDNAFDAGSPVRAAPTFAGGGIVVAARDGRVYKIDPQTGESLGSGFDTDQTVEANLTSNDEENVYLVPRDALLFVIDATGEISANSATSFPLPQ